MAEIEQCTAEQVVDSVEAATLSGKPCTAAEIADFVDQPLATVERATAVATKLGLLAIDGDLYTPAPPYGQYLAEASESHRIDVLRFALEAFPPYRFFKQRLAFHSDALRAARETKLRFGYTNHETEVRETLLSLGQFSGSLSYSRDSGYSVMRSDTIDEFLVVADAVSVIGASIEDFIRERLGAEAYNFIQDEEDDIITHLRAAFARIAAGELDEGTVVLLANACENFLVKLANEANPSVDLEGATGVISKADRLRGANVIAQKQMGYMSFIGQLRNAADHGIDDEVNLDWVITPDAVRLGGFVLLGGIKSVVALIEGRAQF